jgi:hypothetical protein
MKHDFSHVPPAPDSAATLEKIRRQLKVIVYVQAAAALCTIVMGLIAVIEMIIYYPKMSRVLTPDSVALAAENALLTLANARNISSDVAFFTDGAHNAAVAMHPAVGRRALLQAQNLSPELQAAATRVLDALTAQLNTSDLGAPSAFLRYLMGVDWLGQIAPRVDRGLAVAQFGEALAATFLGALATANASATAAMAVAA